MDRAAKIQKCRHVGIWLKCKNFYNFNNIFFDKFKNDFYKSYLKYFIKGDVHFNENGHKLMANEFLDMYQ